MLLQSRRGELQLLPALPAAWQKGCVKKFRAQDGVTVSFAWEEGKLASFALVSDQAQTLCVASGGRKWSVTLEPGKECAVTAE
jgi:alpha-L-fucosidase 2